MPPPPNWDDQFDFDDIDDITKNKKPNNKKAKPNNDDDDDFFDDQNTGNKLPVIESRSSVNKIKPEGRTSARKNPYAENMNLKGNTNIYDNLDDEFEQQIAQEPPKISNNNGNNYGSNKKVTSIKNVSKYAVEDDMKFQEQQIADYPSPKKNSEKRISHEPLKLKQEPKKQESEDNYEQDFEENYGEDFEEEIEEPPKKIETPAIKTEPPQKKKSILNVQPPKPPSRKQNVSVHQQPPKRNQTLAPKDQNPKIPRVPSRQSIKSVSTSKGARNKSNVNRSRVGTNSKIISNGSFIPNKYENQMEKQFPNINLNQLNHDKLSKLNDRIRAMIKRFNEELNDLINKNMLLLKAKKNEKSSSIGDKIRVLEEQKKNNETMIEYMERQYQKLTGREGQLREEEYQLMTEKKIQQAKEKIKQTSKMITKLKYNVKNQGNKLTRKSQDKKIAQQLHHLKTNLIQSKKDEEKQIQRIQKLDEQSSNLNEKISDAEYQISQLIDQAKEKGIKLQNKDELIKKFEETKRKLQANRNHRAKLEHLLKSKSEIIVHEKQQLKIGIKNCDMEIKNLYGSIQHTHNQSVKVVEKAKTNQKISENLTTQLQAILRSLQVTQPDNYSVRSQSNKSRSSHRPLKNSEIGNLQKSQPLRSQPSSNFQKNKQHIQASKQVEQNSISQSKPNLLKKKFKIGGGGSQNTGNTQNEEEKKNEVYERVWKQEEEVKKKAQVQEHKPQPPAEEDKKKPFSLKKNRVSADKNKNENSGYGGLSLGDEKPQNNKQSGLKLDLHEDIKQQVEKKQEQKPSLAGPKMMKFKRRNNDDSNPNTNNISNSEEPSKSLDPPPNLQLNKPEQKQEKLVIEEQKPAFVPKRFNLRRNQQKNNEGSAYMPTVEAKKEEPKKQQTKKEQDTGYKPKLDFGGVDDPFAKKNDPPSNNVSPPKNNSYDPFARKEEPPKQKITIPSIQQKNEDPDSKPRFNLRLRDRKKNNEAENNDGGYLAGLEKKQEPQKQNISNPYSPSNNQPPKQEPQIVNNPYNPYAQQQQQSNPDAPIRRKEGPVKKTKIIPSGPKQKINIYEQAEQAEGLNEFAKEPSPPKNNYNQPSNNLYGNNDKEPDLNDILGLNKNKNKGNDDFSDLIGGGGNDRKAKKKNDFFADMDM